MDVSITYSSEEICGFPERMSEKYQIPPAPLKKGKIFSKSPVLRGMRGGSKVQGRRNSDFSDIL
jgi:hypothetical protein